MSQLEKDYENLTLILVWDFLFSGNLAQSVEHTTVNRVVVGSIPTISATNLPSGRNIKMKVSEYYTSY